MDNSNSPNDKKNEQVVEGGAPLSQEELAKKAANYDATTDLGGTSDTLTHDNSLTEWAKRLYYKNNPDKDPLRAMNTNSDSQKK